MAATRSQRGKMTHIRTGGRRVVACTCQVKRDFEFRVSTDTAAGDSRGRSLHEQHGW